MAALIPTASATGSGTMTLAGPSTNSNQTITIPDATGTMMVSGNMPAFSAYRTTNQSVSGSTWTKVACQTEEFDTASAYDNATNYRFTPQVAGYYQVCGQILNDTSAPAAMRLIISIYKNGSAFKYGQDGASNRSIVSALIYLNGSTDYVELYGNTNSVNPLFQANTPADTYFQAVMVRGA